MDTSFLKLDPEQGAAVFHQNFDNWSNEQIWALFDFILWENQNDTNVMFKWYRALLSLGKGFREAFVTKDSFVCAKTISLGDPIYRCKTCQADGTTLLCVACFMASDHTGHDCGDPESWDPKGFCIHHPGPDAGEHIIIPPQLERVSRLLVGYLVWTISHSLSPSHLDCLYISKQAASKSNYVQRRSSFDTAPSTKTTKSKKKGGGGRFGGLFMFGAADTDSSDDDDNNNNNNNESKNDDSTKDESNGIEARYKEFMKMRQSPSESLEKEKEKKEWILKIESRPFEREFDDVSDPGEAEHCRLGWQHPKDVMMESIGCNASDGTEVAWTLRMYNQCLIASSSTKDYVEGLTEEWDKFGVILGDVPYQCTIIESDQLVRVITKPVLFQLICELKQWSKKSEILKRVVAACLALDIDSLGPQCPGLQPIGTLKVEIGNVAESQTAMYHLILHDHILQNDFNAPLIDLWFSLMTLPQTKRRVTEVFSEIYERMMRFWDFVRRRSELCFIPLSVQLFTKHRTTFQVLESHHLMENVFDTVMLESCPRFVQSLREYKEEHKENDDGNDTNEGKVDFLTLFDAKRHKAEWTGRWILSQKSTHPLYDIRYILSIESFMNYLCLESQHDAQPRFWKRLLHLLSTMQDSKWQKRHSGRDHVGVEDKNKLNVLRLDSSLSGSNHRYLLKALHVMFTKIASEKNVKKDCTTKPVVTSCDDGNGDEESDTKMKTEEEQQEEKETESKSDSMQKATDMILDAMLYGLELLDQRPYNHFKTYFPDLMEVDDVASSDDKHKPTPRVMMKLDNHDNGVLELLEYHAEWTFTEIIDRLKQRHRDTKNGEELDDHTIFSWLDVSLQFMAVFNHSHSDLFKRNGETLALMIYNMEKPKLFSLFITHHFYHVANHATELWGPSNFMTLFFHRHGIHHWFCQNHVQLECSDERVSALDLEKLSADSATGWRHWMDSNRVQKMVKYCINELLSIVSEPMYSLQLDNEAKHTVDVIRYELIQWLVLSSYSMSELESRVIVWGKVESPNIRPILDSIATFDGTQWRLKPKYFEEFNPNFRKYEKFHDSFTAPDEQQEAITKYIESQERTNGGKGKVMWPNWPLSTQLTSDAQLNLFTAPFMGLIWNCILYHIYINAEERCGAYNLHQVLRLISIAIQAMIENRFDLSADSESGNKLISNFCKRFEFRLSEEWDTVTDSNADQLSGKYQGRMRIIAQTSSSSTNKNKMDTDNANDDGDDDEEKKNDDDDQMDKIREAAEAKFKEVVSANDDGQEGIGSAVWFLCKILVDSKPNEETDAPPKMTHVAPEQLLLIEMMLTKMYKMQGLDAIHRVMEPLWKPSDGTKKKKKKKKKKLTAAEKRKLKAEKMRKKAMAKMQKKKGKFAELNSENIKKDELQEEMEEKEQKEAFGIGVKYQCIVCRSRERQDEMSMLAFVTKSGVRARCTNNEKNQPFGSGNDVTFDNLGFSNKGLNFSFCGHSIHKSCYDTHMEQLKTESNRNRHFAGRGSVDLEKNEFCCPYCKTVSNLLIPLRVVHRNTTLQCLRYTDSVKSQNVQTINAETLIIGDEGLLNIERSEQSEVREGLADQFMNHLRKINGDDFDLDNSLDVCNALSYSMVCGEMNFRAIDAKSRSDRLVRWTSNINTFIAALWTLTEEDHLERSTMQQYSWLLVQRCLLSTSQVTEWSDFNRMIIVDAFGLLCRGVLSHPETFCILKSTENTETETDADGDSKMEDEDTTINNPNDEEESSMMIKKKEKNVALQLHGLLGSCFLWHLFQGTVWFCCNLRDVLNDEEVIKSIEESKESQGDEQWLKQSVLTITASTGQIGTEYTSFITQWMVPFLRHCALLFNCFGSIEDLGDLWISDGIDDHDTRRDETDALCDRLHLPTVTEVTSWIANGDYPLFTNYMRNVAVPNMDTFKDDYQSFDRGLPFSLLKLPIHYNDLFQKAAFAKCPRKNEYPRYSCICLICGSYLCIQCCDGHPLLQLTRHAKECNNGFCVFLWIQKTQVIVVWDKIATMMKSIYLDKYGEENYELRRGNRISLDEKSYRELQRVVTEHKIPNKLVQLRKTGRDLLERHQRL